MLRRGGHPGVSLGMGSSGEGGAGDQRGHPWGQSRRPGRCPRGWEEMGSLASRWALHPHQDEVPWGQQPPLHLSLCFLNGFGFFFFLPGELRKT